MPIAGTPIIVHLMRLYAAQGFTKFVLAAGHRQEILRDYFDDRLKDWDITIVDTGSESDTGERIRRCAPYVGDTFFATYGDGLGDIDLHQLLDFHKASGGLATVTSVPLRSQYGLVMFDSQNRVLAFREKPQIREYWINAGFLVLEKAVFDEWEGQSLEGEVLPNIAKKGLLHTYLHEGFWKSMDTSKDQQEMESLFRGIHSPWTFHRSVHKAAGGMR